MNKYNIFNILAAACLCLTGCADNELEVKPNDNHFPFRLIADAEKGADLPDAEDYDLEITFADYIGSLPNETITVDYEISDLEDDMEGSVAIDKITYEVEMDDCIYERELEFTASANGLSGTITIAPDQDLGSVPETFEIVFTLPGNDDTEGKFSFALTGIRSNGNIILGAPVAFEYEVLDNDAAGEWELELQTEEEFEAFKKVFGPLNADLEALAFEDVTGKVAAEFEFEEMKFVIELKEEETVTVCEDGEAETETANRVIEIEAEYEAEDGELALEGSHFIIGDDGEVEDELDFIVEAGYETGADGETLSVTFTSVVDEDNFSAGEALFESAAGVKFVFVKD